MPLQYLTPQPCRARTHVSEDSNPIGDLNPCFEVDQEGSATFMSVGEKVGEPNLAGDAAEAGVKRLICHPQPDTS
jgi:hypothetical protein